MKKIVISLGGSLIVPSKIDTEYLNEFRSFIQDYINKEYSFLIVTGGGKTARNYRDSACNIAEISEVDKHLIGVQATRLNAELLRSIFGATAYRKVLIDYTKKVNTKKRILIAGGFKPGTTTDFETVNWAINLGADKIINLSNVDYVFYRDPNIYAAAKPIDKISWKEFLRLIKKDNLGGGNHFPFDPFASKLAMKNKLQVAIMGKSISNLEEYLLGESFKGTIIN